LFDPAGIAQVGGVKLEAHDRAARIVETPVAAAEVDTPVLLFVGLDGGRRAMRLAVVDRIEEVPTSSIRHGAGQLRVQLGEAILPLAGANGELPAEKVRLFRLNDGTCEIGYAFREVIDLSAIAHDVIPAEHPGEVSAVTLVAGEPAELVDPHWLFSTFLTATERMPLQPVCRLPADDPWMQNMLRPIVEAAGYLVIGESDELAADLTIISHGDPVEEGQGGRVLRLATDPDKVDGKDSIYRYDRTGLLLALKSASGGGR